MVAGRWYHGAMAKVSRRGLFGLLAAAPLAALPRVNLPKDATWRPLASRHIEFTCKYCKRFWAITIPACTEPVEEMDVCPECQRADGSEPSWARGHVEREQSELPRFEPGCCTRCGRLRQLKTLASGRQSLCGSCSFEQAKGRHTSD